MIRGYSAPFVSEMIGVPYATLDSWVRTGLFIPSVAQAKGRGSRRLYSDFDVLVLKIVNFLKRSGLHNEAIEYLIAGMRDNEATIMEGNSEQILLFDVTGVMRIYNNRHEMFKAFMPGRPLWIMPIGLVKLEVFGELKERNRAIEENAV